VPKPAVIVVNSQVARGSVGGRAGVFALERMGYPVWFVPTVTLTWHPGHGPATRLVTPTAAFNGFVGELAGAAATGGVGAILTGYLGAAEQAAAIAALVAAVKARDPAAPYLCDPDIGDADGLFQPEAVAAVARDRLMPLADMTTPNRHELAWLTGRAADDNDDLTAAAKALAVAEVVVTSAFAGPGAVGNLVVAAGEPHLAAHRRADHAPHGTGDLFAALYLGARLDGRSPADAADRATAAVAALVERAQALGLDELPLAGAETLF